MSKNIKMTIVLNADDITQERMKKMVDTLNDYQFHIVDDDRHITDNVDKIFIEIIPEGKYCMKSLTLELKQDL